MIQPGDIREVLERQASCRQKSVQALRKRDAIRANLPDVLKALELAPDDDWRVEALVIVDNFGGAPSTSPKEAPVVPRKIFAQALSLAPDLDRLHAAFTSPDWLPREGRDYHRPFHQVDIGGVEMELPFFVMGAEAYMRDNLETYLQTAYARTPQDLRAQFW